MANQLGEYLTHLRARARPAEHGIATTARRRVAGLRREEVAQLIGVSMEYYARLERGVARAPSASVLDSIGRVFALSGIEREHLAQLAGAVSAPRRSDAMAETTVRQGLAGLIDSMPGPALISNHRFDVLAANQLARSVFFDFASAHRGNLARFLFTDPLAMRRYRDWPEVAHATAGQLRVAAARHGDDSRLHRLIGDLRAEGHHFERLWESGEVAERSHGMKRLWVDAVGELDLAYQNLELPEDRNLRLVLLYAESGTVAADQLRLLASLQSERAASNQPGAAERSPGSVSS
ncbi:helix-turn-helix transcriptional regulator [Enemella evansiae]|uniref:helix-turn-helix transcriptional regulator n=1 Tax=Enemella evansiae TaxID=2016499 RepID=UPI0015574815|nr:helix-turn-helix transcriptional regulator [Enemella evansiae]